MHHRIRTSEDVEVEYPEIVKGREIDEDEYPALTKDEIKVVAALRTAREANGKRKSWSNG